MTKARLIYLVVIAALFAFSLASVMRFSAAAAPHVGGFSPGNGGFSPGDG